jgi:phosphotransferase system enzyme I (PtsI)
VQSFKGKSVHNGIVMGPVVVFRKFGQAERKEIADPKAELDRLETALTVSKQQLAQLYEKALGQVGQASAAVFEVHRMLLEDKRYLEEISSKISREYMNAEYAVALVGDNFSKMFESMEDDYMKARGADILDVSLRVVSNLKGDREPAVQIACPSILVAEDLSPSETMLLDREKVLAIVTRFGSVHSHTAILARMMNIPAIVNVPFAPEDVMDGETAIVDGFSGIMTVAPDKRTATRAEKRIIEEREKQILLKELKGKENITLDGRKIRVCANIGSTADVSSVIENDAQGIGLFRSEFLYIGRDSYPTEDEQFDAYKQVLDEMNGQSVVIRTLDIGADKQADYLQIEKEENPALGYRGIRVCLTQKEMFKTQLRALFRAAYYGDISVLYPMIISAEEVEKIGEIVEEVGAELETEGLLYKIPKQGIMIETPAAVMISDKLAEMVDFLSIGTNDLAQYTMAIDRQNEKLDAFYNPHHESILRMIKMVVDNAHACGKWVGICGELAADEQLTEMFIRIGVDELSVAPSMILKLRKKIRQMCVKEPE